MGHPARLRVPALAVLALVLGSPALGSCVGESTLEAYELSGHVTSLLEGSDSGDAVPNARVTFVSDTLLVEETTADGAGRYRMRIVTDHPFGQVRAEAEGFLPHEETVYFDTPQRRVDVALRRQAM